MDRDEIITNMYRRRLARRKREHKMLLLKNISIVGVLLSCLVAVLLIFSINREVAEAEELDCYPIHEQAVETLVLESEPIHYIYECDPVCQVLEEELVEPEDLDPDEYVVAWLDGMRVSLEEFKLICTTVACEGGCTRDYIQRNKLIAKTILNRVASDDFPDTIHDVVYQKNQYCVTNWNGFPEAYEDRITEAVEEAVFLAIAMDDAPLNLYFFRTDYYFSWAKEYWNDGIVYFSCKQED